MTTRTGMAIALAAALAACGGSDPKNAAADKKFTYDTPVAASGSQSSAVNASISSAQGLKSSPDESAAQSFADFSVVTSALLGDSIGLPGAVAPGADARTALFVARRAGVAATSGSFQNPGCVTKTLTSVTLSGCKVVVTDTTDGTTITVTADGTLSAAVDTLTWDLTVRVGLSGLQQGASISGSVHDSGTVTVTATTAVGAMRRELRASASANGQSASMGMDESLDFDVTHEAGCVTGGTLEAKRVWTQRPQGVSAVDFPDRGAKVTWSGCGIATIALSR